jgi:cell division septation protein DedD
MAGETILVIDADKDIDQRIATALEALGYLVFTASSRVLNAETLEKLSPSLIYVKPLAPSAAGLEPCKTVHGIPALKSVPIVLLASLRALRDPRYLTVYGIVDFLKLTFGPDEVIEKTETILGKARPPRLPERHEWPAEKSANDRQATRSASAAEDNPSLTEKEFLELASPGNHVPPPVSQRWNDEEGEQSMRPAHESPWSKTFEGKGRKRSLPLLPAIGAAIFLAIAGAGFLIYNHFTPSRKVRPIRPVIAPFPVRSKAPDTRSEPQVSLESNGESKVTDAPAPSPPPPSTAPTQDISVSSEPARQLLRKPSYSVQIGAFKNEAYAQVLVEEFLGKGYDAFIQPGVTKDKSPIYRVLISKDGDKKAVEKLAREIQTKEKIEATLYVE